MSTKEPPTIESAWDSFERDLVASKCTPDTIANYKLAWYAGAMSMGIILTSREVLPEHKVTAFHSVATWLAERPQFARFAEKVKGHAQPT